jgi:hypothetical protein
MKKIVQHMKLRFSMLFSFGVCISLGKWFDELLITEMFIMYLHHTSISNKPTDSYAQWTLGEHIEWMRMISSGESRVIWRKYFSYSKDFDAWINRVSCAMYTAFNDDAISAPILIFSRWVNDWV